MTTPNLPWDTTTDSDLPQGVIAPKDLGVRLQQHAKDDYTNIVASRIPGVAQSTAAGSARSGPFGFIVGLFSQVTSNVATADPADINGPDDIVARAGNFFGGLPLVSLLGGIAEAITGVIGGGFNTISTFFSQLLQAGPGIPIIGPIASGLLGFFFHQTAIANTATQAQTTATLAIAAADEANNAVKALITGGTRTLHTQNFTYTKPPNLISLMVITIGAGGAGGNGQPPGAGISTGGGYACSEEFPASAVPATVQGTVPSGANGGSNSTGNIQAKFGDLLSSPPSNTGVLVEPRGLGDLSRSCPGQSYGAANYGGSSTLAAGGAPGQPGQPGANAPTTGTALCGGGAGGGGASVPYSNSFVVIGGGPGAGGPGGFPGGPGGAGGRDSLSGAPGGPGAPALIALIEKLGPEVTP